MKLTTIKILADEKVSPKVVAYLELGVMPLSGCLRNKQTNYKLEAICPLSQCVME